MRSRCPISRIPICLSTERSSLAPPRPRRMSRSSGIFSGGLQRERAGACDSSGRPMGDGWAITDTEQTVLCTCACTNNREGGKAPELALALRRTTPLAFAFGTAAQTVTARPKPAETPARLRSPPRLAGAAGGAEGHDCRVRDAQREAMACRQQVGRVWASALYTRPRMRTGGQRRSKRESRPRLSRAEEAASASPAADRSGTLVGAAVAAVPGRGDRGTWRAAPTVRPKWTRSVVGGALPRPGQPGQWRQRRKRVSRSGEKQGGAREALATTRRSKRRLRDEVPPPPPALALPL